MTKGMTTLEFSHDTKSAVQASLDALTLALAWAPKGTNWRNLEIVIIS